MITSGLCSSTNLDHVQPAALEVVDVRHHGLEPRLLERLADELEDLCVGVEDGDDPWLCFQPALPRVPSQPAQATLCGQACSLLSVIGTRASPERARPLGQAIAVPPATT